MKKKEKVVDEREWIAASEEKGQKESEMKWIKREERATDKRK